MSNEFPKPPPVESKEAGNAGPTLILERKILETREDGSKIEETLECNGRIHRRCVDLISYNEAGQATYAEEVSQEELGACDGKHS